MVKAVKIGRGTVQGVFVKAHANGKVTVRVGRKLYIGLPV